MNTCTATTPPMWAPGRYGPAQERPEPLTCRRTVDATGRHRGQHQATEVISAVPPNPLLPHTSDGRPEHLGLVTWGNGGASGNHLTLSGMPGAGCDCSYPPDTPRGRKADHTPDAHYWRECDLCGIVRDARTETRCHTCTYWSYRVEILAAGGWTEPERRGAPRPRLVVPHDRDNITVYAWSPGHGGAFGGRQYRVTFDDGEVVGPADFLWYNGIAPWEFAEQITPNAVVEAVDKRTLRPGHTTGPGGTGAPLEFNGGLRP